MHVDERREAMPASRPDYLAREDSMPRKGGQPSVTAAVCVSNSRVGC